MPAIGFHFMLPPFSPPSFWVGQMVWEACNELDCCPLAPLLPFGAPLAPQEDRGRLNNLPSYSLASFSLFPLSGGSGSFQMHLGIGTCFPPLPLSPSGASWTPLGDKVRGEWDKLHFSGVSEAGWDPAATQHQKTVPPPFLKLPQ